MVKGPQRFSDMQMEGHHRVAAVDTHQSSERPAPHSTGISGRFKELRAAGVPHEEAKAQLRAEVRGGGKKG